uniref:DUF4388 domain-containing protein n=1 Tax=Strongyloides venezuelensis TaxID=75913 RepID=A0A0K0FEZ2_STRVS
MEPKISNKFHTNVNGCEKNIVGTGFHVTIDELENCIHKNFECFIFGDLEILRIATIGSHLFQSGDNNSVVLRHGNNEIKLNIKNEKLKTLLKEIFDDNNCEGILVFITYDVSNEVISEFILEEVHKIFHFSSYMEQFLNEMDIMRKALSLDFFNNENYVSNGIPQSSLDYTSVSSNSCNNTPRSRPDKSLKIFLRRLKNFQLCNKIFKMSFPVSTNMIEHNNHKYISKLKSSDVIRAIELGIMSSGNEKIEIEAIKNFLGISKLELARHLFKLNHLYEIIDNMTNIQKV